MTFISILLSVILGSALIALLVMAYIYDIRLEKFRAALKPGQEVFFFCKGQPGYGIVSHLDDDFVTLIDKDTLEQLNVEKYNIYQT